MFICHKQCVPAFLAGCPCVKWHDNYLYDMKILVNFSETNTKGPSVYIVLI